jgi:hypothetical protein
MYVLSLTLHATFADNCSRPLSTARMHWKNWQLELRNMALMNEEEAVSREMIEHFAGCAQYYLVNISDLILCRILIDDVLVELSKMSKRASARQFWRVKKARRSQRLAYEEFPCAFAYTSQLNKISMQYSLAQNHANH